MGPGTRNRPVWQFRPWSCTGPGDILGFDEQIIIRRDPQPNIGDFEPNFLPIVEFADADFPWRFTPNAAAQRGLTPWISLIVLETDSAEWVEATPAKRNLPGCIEAKVTKLPNLDHAWRWAHVMVTADHARRPSRRPSCRKLTPTRIA